MEILLCVLHTLREELENKASILRVFRHERALRRLVRSVEQSTRQNDRTIENVQPNASVLKRHLLHSHQQFLIKINYQKSLQVFHQNV